MDVPPSDGVLMVGSVPFHSTTDVFNKLCRALPGRLCTIPDGETGDRSNYVWWQFSRFPPEFRVFEAGGVAVEAADLPPFAIESIKPTGYDEAALSSYKQFVELRKKGVIPSDVRFQVCLPTPFNPVMGGCRSEYQKDVEPLYEQRFEESLDRIINGIPHDDFVIQWDIAFEIMLLEIDAGRYINDRFKLWFEPARRGILQRIIKICQRVPSDVGQAFHLCYGDLFHQHFVEPTDLGMLIDLANDLVHAVSKTHRVEWVHVPVPKNRLDKEYYAPLGRLKLGRSRLYLGLIHANDENGTRARIDVARKAYSRPFGVATECGLGRTPKEEIDSILAIANAVTAPPN